MITVTLALMLQAANAERSRPSIELLVSSNILHKRLASLLLDDPAMRAEVRRVGFETGCRALSSSRSEVASSFAPELASATGAAIRKIVPAEMIDPANPSYFLSAPMFIYGNKIANELQLTAAATLTRADTEAQAAFLRRTRDIPTIVDPKANIVVPKADLAEALGLGATYDLDKSQDLGMACAELLVSPANRPTITTGPRQREPAEVQVLDTRRNRMTPRR